MLGQKIVKVIFIQTDNLVCTVMTSMIGWRFTIEILVTKKVLYKTELYKWDLQVKF